jgi:hypothetical protein
VQHGDLPGVNVALDLLSDTFGTLDYLIDQGVPVRRRHVRGGEDPVPQGHSVGRLVGELRQHQAFDMRRHIRGTGQNLPSPRAERFRKLLGLERHSIRAEQLEMYL